MLPFILAAIGGSLIGLSAIMMMGFNGRIAGISGILSGAFSEAGSERLWRILFIVGVIGGGTVPLLFSDGFKPPIPETSTLVIVIGALAVGIGTGLGNGCTSGHGICGIARISPRSIIATCTFMAAGFACVYLLKHVFGGQ